MASHAAVSSFGQTLVRLLADGLSGLVPAGNVVLATPDDFASYAGANTPTVTVFLYRVGLQPELRNRPLRQLPDGSRTRPLLPLELSYLITPWAREPADEQLIIGRILQVLYDETEIGPADLPVSAGWETGDSVQLILDSLPMEDHMRLWDSAEMPYRLSLAYLARVVGIEPTQRRVTALVVDADLRTGRLEIAGTGT